MRTRKLKKFLNTRRSSTTSEVLISDMDNQQAGAMGGLHQGGGDGQGGTQPRNFEGLNEILQALLPHLNQGLNISGDSIEKTIPEFRGTGDISPEKWFSNYEETAAAYRFTEAKMYVHARNKMTGDAKLFLQCQNVIGYPALKAAIIEEFTRSFSSQEIHKKLTARLKKKEETFYEYVLEMRKIASYGDLDQKSIINYIVDGIDGKLELKVSMYNSKTFAELREQYATFEKLSNIGDSRWNKTTKKVNIENEKCYKCGSKSHKKHDCPNEIKCFRCNKSGHISKDCNQKTDNKMNFIVSNSMMKTITVDD